MTKPSTSLSSSSCRPSCWLGVVSPADPALDAYAARERAMLIEDINRIRPSVILVDNLTDDWSAWLQSHPDVSSLLSDYQLAETINGIAILSKAR